MHPCPFPHALIAEMRYDSGEGWTVRPASGPEPYLTRRVGDMDLQTQYQQEIRRAFPQIQIKTARFRRGGQFSDVLIINGNIVFR